jgi:hypothetical protein
MLCSTFKRRIFEDDCEDEKSKSFKQSISTLTRSPNVAKSFNISQKSKQKINFEEMTHGYKYNEE